MKFRSLVFLGLLLLGPVVVWAAFDDVTLSSGDTLRVVVGSTTVDLSVNGGKVQDVTVNASNLTVTLVAGSSLDVTSSTKRNITYAKVNANAGFTCGTSSSTLTLSLGAGQTTETVTITPSDSACVPPSQGSGGGSSSSSSTTSTTSTTSSTSSTSSTTSTTPSTTTTTATTATTPSTTTSTTAALAPATIAAVTTPSVPVAVSAPVAVLFSEINPGTRSDEVRTLQTLLASDPTIYPEGTVSGFYGPKTTAAVKKFQAKYGLPTVGRVGPATLEKINEVYGVASSAVTAPTATAQTQMADQIQSQIQTIQNQINALTSGAAVTGAITSELDPGTRSDEVRTLQTLLASDPTIYPEGTVSGFYGPKTTAAVKKFQAKYGLPTVGRVGPATMQKINEVLGGQSAPVTSESPSSQAPAPSATASMIDQITAQIRAIQDQIKALQGQ